MFTFLHKKKITFQKQIVVRCTPLINIFGLKSRTLSTTKTVDYFFQQLVLHIYCKHFVQGHPINAHNLPT